VAETVPGVKYTFDELSGRMRFTIPVRRQWLLLFFALLLLSFVLPIFILMSSDLNDVPIGMKQMFIWGMVVWGTTILWLLIRLLLSFMGRDVLVVDATSVRLRREVLGIGHTRHYAGERVTRLRVEPYYPPLGIPIDGLQAIDNDTDGEFEGPLVFDVDGKIMRFGGITEAEAKQIVLRIGERYPQYVTANYRPTESR
jgi:hypothetical protein